MRLLSSLFLSAFLLLIAALPAIAGGDQASGALIELLHNKGVLDDASYGELRNAGQGGESKLLDVLYKKGVIDEATYKDLSAKAVAEAKAPAAPQASAAPAERPLDQVLTAMEEGFVKLGGPDTKLKIGMFFQGGWVNDDSGSSVAIPPTTLISTTAGNQFFVRRARLFFNGMLTKKVGYKISLEGAPSSAGVLQDAYIFFDYIPYTRVVMGQQKIPFGLENYEALGDNPMINRSFISNFENPTLRDIGLLAQAKYSTDYDGMPLAGNLWVGVFNGTGRNVADNNDAKDVVARLTFTPLIEGLSMGGSLSYGKTHFTPSGNPDFNKDRDRYAAELDYNPPYLKGLKVRGEFMYDRKFFDKFVTTNQSTTSPAAFNKYAHTEGWYALAAYRVNGLQGFWRYMNGLEPVIRYDQFDEDQTLSNDSRDRTTVGFNYYFAKYCRLMANYEIIHADGGLKQNSLEQIDLIGHHILTTLVQVKF